MNRRPVPDAIHIRSTNPLVNGLLIVLGAVVFGAAMLLGLVVVAIFSASLLVLACVVSIRIWWLRRKQARSGGRPPGPRRAIEGEFHVIDGENSDRGRG